GGPAQGLQGHLSPEPDSRRGAGRAAHAGDGATRSAIADRLVDALDPRHRPLIAVDAIPASEPSGAPLRIGIVVGEASGDILGADLMRALRAHSRRPIEFCGVGGALMAQEDFTSLFDIERLAVMGFVEPFKRLP